MEGRPISRAVAVVTIVGAVLVFGAVGVSRLKRGPDGPAVPSVKPPVTVPLFVPPDAVVQRSRLRFSFDPPEVLSSLRSGEDLDEIVTGAANDQEAWTRLSRWTARQWQHGVPDPYPPPDARLILRDIRSGRTGGFCAQYCVVLIQAIQSFGHPARQVTIEGHEVVEAWLDDEQRWIVLDPTYDLAVLDGNGRALNALEIRRAVEGGQIDRLRLTDGHRAPETALRYLSRYRQVAVWIRNDLVSRPMNFTDFDRYRVWFAPPDPSVVPPESLSTTAVEDLWPGLPERGN